MVLGFNHNIRYKGVLFHVQTEDSGKANPHIITLLYREGTIIASAKTSYADIITVEQLEAVVESIMKEQHKDMMRRLKNGEFDARIFPDGAPEPTAAPQKPGAAPQTPEVPAPQVQAAAPQTPAAASQAPEPPRDTPPTTPANRSLDEVILDYLITGEDK
ncbi:MAG: hypothetical protein FPO08_10615 [Geobacter sp.]|nr:MAG: hypothetical protein FPO08_10615 [Geobacter sp.]